MFLTKLALKNLVRHRKRTLITAFIIAAAIFFYILMDSLIGGMTEMSFQTIIDYEAGHLQVVAEEYWRNRDEMPLDNLISTQEQQEIMAAASDVPQYIQGSTELVFTARLNNGENELPVIGKGILPDEYTGVFELQDKFVEGNMFSQGENKAVLGKKLADLMRLKKGDFFTILVKDKNNTFNTIDIEISGLLHTANPVVNNNTVYVPLSIAQKALKVGNSVSKIVVRLPDKDQAPLIAPELEKRLQDKGIPGELTVRSWDQLEAVTVAGAKQMGNQLIMTIILLIAAIAIINTVILAALERMEEIGMLKAMGMTNKEIIYTFVLESTGIGILGGAVGLIMGTAGVWLLSRYGIDFSQLTGIEMSQFGIPVIGKIYGIWNPEAYIKVFAFGVLMSLFSSILPAYWAADKDPIKAIYHR
ncbi:MAG: ABC transporter permease [Halanaerobiales bacterium]